MGKKYLETKKDSLESSILGVWKTAIEEGDARMDGRTKQYKEHRKKLESRRVRKEEVEIDEGKMKELHGYIQDGKSAEEIAKIMKLDVKTIKALMSGYNEEVELDENGTHVNPKDREELDKAPSDTAKKMKRAKDPAPNQMAEAQSGDKEAYKKFFDAALKKFKVSSPADFKSDEEKKKFYDYIDKNWEGDNEKAESAMSQVREFKMQSMKAALAQIWGMEEGHNPFAEHKGTKPHKHPHEENEKEVVKDGKTETGKKPATIDLKPKLADK